MEIISGILIGLVSAISTVTFSFWRFRSERWWELKEETYIRIIESLYHIKQYFYYLYSANEESGVQNDEKYIEVRRFKKSDNNKEVLSLETLEEEALTDLAKIIDTSSFIIRQDALDELTKLKTKYKKIIHEDDIDTWLEETKELVDHCLSKIKVIARDDLETVADKISSKIKSLFFNKNI